MELPELIASLAARPGPVMTWYGESRTELGGGVAARWLAKTANLLAGDLAGDLFGDGAGADPTGSHPDAPGTEPGTPRPAGTIRVDLDCSWQSVTWLAAAWLSGWRSVGTGVAGTDEGATARVDVWVSDRIGPEHLAAAAEGCWVLAQATTPLALSWPGPLPEGVLDALAELSAQSDALETVTEVDPELVIATTGAGTPPATLTASDLGTSGLRIAAGTAEDGVRRVLIPSTGPAEDTRAVLAHWNAGRSVVVVDPRVHEDRAHERIAHAERAEALSDGPAEPSPQRNCN